MANHWISARFGCARRLGAFWRFTPAVAGRALISSALALSSVAQASAAGFDVSALLGATFERENSSGFCGNDTTFSFLTSSAVRVGSNTAFCDAEERGVYEFDLSPLTGGDPITSVDLILGGIIDTGLDLHGFAGNGSIDLSDGNTENLLAAGADTDTVDVTAFVQSLLGAGETFAGFMLDDRSLISTGSAGGSSLRTYAGDAVLSVNGGAIQPPPPPPGPPPADLVVDAAFGATFERENSDGFCASRTFFSFLTSSTVRVGTNTDLCNAEERGVFEFDLTPLASSLTILSANLVVSGIIDSAIDVHAFLGDGVIGAADGNSENLLTSGADTNSLDVTAFIKSLLANGGAFAGFMFDDPSVISTGSAGNAPLRTFGANASLEINFVDAEVPEPATLALILFALGGIYAARRIRTA